MLRNNTAKTTIRVMQSSFMRKQKRSKLRTLELNNVIQWGNKEFERAEEIKGNLRAQLRPI